MSTLIFRNRHGELVDIPAITATHLKNEFGSVFEQAVRSGAVVITWHERPRAVLVSYEEFQVLIRDRLPSLSDYDALLSRMQTPAARRAMADAFNAIPPELGRAATKAARKRR
jgi:prevent-host-death family protein